MIDLADGPGGTNNFQKDIFCQNIYYDLSIAQPYSLRSSASQWCSQGHTQVYAVCLLFSSGCLRITTSKDQYLRIPSVYPLVLLLRKSVIYCSFPYNGVPYSCVKLVILCCNWCIITSVILPFPAHHRLSARVCCIERTPLKAAFVFHLRAGRAYWPPGVPGHSRWIGHRSEEELPHIRHCF